MWMQLMQWEDYLRASQQLEHENAQRPVIDGPVVTFVEDDLGRHVLGCPAESPRLVAHSQHFRKAEIYLLGKQMDGKCTQIH